MTTWRADVFPDSSVGEISVEVEASTFHGAERQIRTIYGDVQYIRNLREVGMFSGGSRSQWYWMGNNRCSLWYIFILRILDSGSYLLE